jgi:hypothetical protein
VLATDIPAFASPTTASASMHVEAEPEFSEHGALIG